MDNEYTRMATMVALRSTLRSALDLMTDQQRKELLDQVSANIALFSTGFPPEIESALFGDGNNFKNQVLASYQKIEVMIRKFKDLATIGDGGSINFCFMCASCGLISIDGQPDSSCPSCGSNGSFELFIV